jgi:iron(III) transport system permease protein
MNENRSKNMKILRNKLRTFFQKPEYVILLIFGILLTLVTIVPMLTLLNDTFLIKPGSYSQFVTGKSSGYTFVNWVDLFFGEVSKINLYNPLKNSILLAVFASFGAILFGGIFAYLITRTNIAAKKYLSAIFIFPYIMPQWTLAVIWQNLFKNNAITGGSDGVFAAFFNINMPGWWGTGLFPSILNSFYSLCAFCIYSYRKYF